MKVKTTDLTGRALDWAVGVAVGRNVAHQPDGPVYDKDTGEAFDPTTDWGQLGQYTDLISWVETGAGFSICLYDCDANRKDESENSLPSFGFGRDDQFEISLCRAIVDLYIGDTVDVPEVLL